LERPNHCRNASAGEPFTRPALARACLSGRPGERGLCKLPANAQACLCQEAQLRACARVHGLQESKPLAQPWRAGSSRSQSRLCGCQSLSQCCAVPNCCEARVKLPALQKRAAGAYGQWAQPSHRRWTERVSGQPQTGLAQCPIPGTAPGCRQPGREPAQRPSRSQCLCLSLRQAVPVQRRAVDPPLRHCRLRRTPWPLSTVRLYYRFRG